MGYGVSNAAIAEHIGISRQMVTKHRRRGMPCDSLGAASAWYFTNVSTSRRKRGTFSNLPTRLPRFDFDDDATAAAIASLSGADEASAGPPPLDDFPAGFWGTSATKSILDILGNGSTATFRKRESILAAFLCIFAAMRLHLRLMPRIMAGRVGARDREAAEAALMEWSCQFAAHWFGADFEREPILPANIERLSDFFRPLEGKE
jgi:hypothetical protein